MFYSLVFTEIFRQSFLDDFLQIVRIFLAQNIHKYQRLSGVTVLRTPLYCRGPLLAVSMLGLFGVFAHKPLSIPSSILAGTWFLLIIIGISG